MPLPALKPLPIMPAPALVLDIHATPTFASSAQAAREGLGTSGPGPLVAPGIRRATSSEQLDAMDDLHAKQRAGEPLHPDRYCIAPKDQLGIDCKRGVHNVLLEAHQILPRRFFKHVQSRAMLDQVLEAHPQDRATPVNRVMNGESVGQTLEERYISHLTSRGRARAPGTLKKTPTFYSLSIEKKRLTTVEMTLQLFSRLREEVA